VSQPVVFLGPTLDIVEARGILDADYRPPARCGDVLRAVLQGAQRIGIVDGFFHAVRSVRHAEILLALEDGVEVVGAASMGALRAAECAAFGMVGIGEVFARYRSGELERDDAVAVLHDGGDAGYRPISDALVDMCDAYAAAANDGVVDGRTAAWLCTRAESMHYTERTYRRVVADAVDEGVVGSTHPLLEFLAAHRPTLKQRDARALLRHLRDPATVRTTPTEVAVTSHTQALIDEVRSQWFPWGRILPGTLRAASASASESAQTTLVGAKRAD
jgi:hypothetical protein